MARPGERWLNVGPLKGHNTSDNPLALGEGWATDTLNIVLEPSLNVAVKRKGSTMIDPAPASPYLLTRFLPPDKKEADAELWMFDYSQTGVLSIFRQVAGGATESIAVPSTLQVVTRVLQFNGKLFLAGMTTVNRLHCWDGTTIRLVGLVRAVIPTVANSGTGSYPATLRYYKVSYRRVDSASRVTARSELSSAVSFTPSGTGSAVTITVGTFETSVTHWTVWGSPDNASYFNLSGALPVSQTSYLDTVLPANYTGEQAPLVGSFLPPPSVTHIMTDGHRLLMMGNGGPNSVPTMPDLPDPRVNRVWYTPVLGTTDQGDDERIPITNEQRNFLDVGDVMSGATSTIAGASLSELVGPMDGQIYVFQSRRIWRLVPTGDLVTPYLVYSVSDRYGAHSAVQQSIHPHYAQFVRAVSGEDEQGQPAIYFLSATGLYRCSSGSNVQYVGYDIEKDFYAAFSATTYLFSYPDARQLWIVAPLDSLNKTRIFVFHWAEGAIGRDGTVREGWTIWDWTSGGIHTHLRSGVLMNATPGAMGPAAERRIPYFAAMSGFIGIIARFERPEAIDGTNTYSAHVTSAPFLPTQSERQLRVGNPQLTARALANTSLRVSAIRDFGTETRIADISIAPEGGETHVMRTVEGLFQGDVTALQITVSDPVPQAALWEVDLLAIPVTAQEPR